MLRAVIIIGMLATSFVSIMLFLAKWHDTDFDTAWKTFEKHVDACLGELK